MGRTTFLVAGLALTAGLGALAVGRSGTQTKLDPTYVAFYAEEGRRSPWQDGLTLTEPQSNERLTTRVATTGQQGAAVYYALNVEFTCPEAREAFCRQRARKAGAWVITEFAQFADLFVSNHDEMKAIEADPGVRWLELAAEVYPPPRPEPPPAGTAADEVEKVISGGLSGWTGKGVIIAIADTGVDFRHKDFIVPDAQNQPTSRLLAFWDTTSDDFEQGRWGQKPPICYPENRPIGTIYTQEDLNRQLRCGDAPNRDLYGHGTACARIVAGNGKSLGTGPFGTYAGVAPEADLIAIRLSRLDEFQSAYLLGAVYGWLDQEARRRGKPLVLSCSFGGQDGGRDGYRVAERQLDARLRANPEGRSVCVSAGNEGANPVHAGVKFGGLAQLAEVDWLAGRDTRLSRNAERITQFSSCEHHHG
jgi:subtilisin family serine protease